MSTSANKELTYDGLVFRQKSLIHSRLQKPEISTDSMGHLAHNGFSQLSSKTWFITKFVELKIVVARAMGEILPKFEFFLRLLSQLHLLRSKLQIVLEHLN